MRQIVDCSKPAKQTGFAGAHPGLDRGAAHVTENERQVPTPVVPGVLAVIGAAALVVFLAGCGSANHTASITVPVNKNPFGVALDAGTRAAYVTNSGDNTVSVIDSSTHTVISTMPVGTKP